MRIGDLVKWIGFPGREINYDLYSDGDIGLIINVATNQGDTRYWVMWQDGTIGTWLFEETIEVILPAGKENS